MDDNFNQNQAGDQNQPVGQNFNQPVAPVVAPPLPVPQEFEQPSRPSLGAVAFQILTYALWFWLVVCLVWIVKGISETFVAGSSADDFFSSAIVAAAALLIVVFLVDIVFRFNEVEKKVGLSKAAVIVNAVIFGLASIGAMALAAYFLVSIVIEPNVGSDEKMSIIVVGIFASVISAAAFIRIAKPFMFARLALVFRILMLITTALLIIIGTSTPMSLAIAQRKDGRIQSHIEDVNSGIRNFIQDNQKLPDSLFDVELDTKEAKSLVQDGLVDYKKADKKVEENKTSYRYELCVQFEKSSKGYDSLPDSIKKDNGSYKTFLSSTPHPAGNVCYKLATVLAND